jgi:hypothetical protein
MHLEIGDRIYCPKEDKYGFVTRKQAFGIVKSEAIGIQWDNKQRTFLFGNDCGGLVKQ